MEGTHRGLRAEQTHHRVVDHLQVAGKLGVMVVGWMGHGVVPTMVAKVEDDHVKAVQEKSPKGKVAIDSKTVAMAEEHPHVLIGIAVPPEMAATDSASMASRRARHIAIASK